MNTQIIMTDRPCGNPRCKKHFKVNIDSNQWFCNSFCLTETPNFKPPKKTNLGATTILLTEDICQDPNNPLRKESRPPGLIFGSAWPTQKPLRKLERIEGRGITPPKKESVKSVEPAIINTKSKRTLPVSFGQQITESSKTLLKGETMKQTKSKELSSYKPGKNAETLPEVYTSQSLILEMVGSPEQSLINESVQQLVGLMKTATRSAKDKNDVSAACNCAKQITGLLRLKLDIYKASK